MTSLRIGPLRLLDGGLRTGHGEASHVVVWPPDFEVSREGDLIWVFYDDHEVEVRLGQAVSLMGGEVQSIEAFDERTRQQVPAGCEGSYWLAGSITPAGAIAGAAASKDLVGSEWLLVSLHGEPLIKGTEITLRFAEEHLSGSMTCNGYRARPNSGGYGATEDGTLEVFEPLMLTAQQCRKPAGIMEQEASYIEALQSAAAYQTVFDSLQVAHASGEVTLVFVRRE